MALMDRPQWIQSTILFFSFLLFYATFRSPDLMAVDGPPRSCEVYHRQEIFFHGNNHLLYPVNVRMWDRLMRLLLDECEDPLQFARRTQLMNGFAAAASVAVMFLLVRGGTGSRGIAIWAACAYGFSRAVLLHATNAAEPPVGLLMSFSAVAAAAMARKAGRVWLAALAGVLLAAAMATYQTMILVGPAVLLLCAARTAGQPASGVSVSRDQALRVIGLLAGSTVGVVGIYAWAYSRQGISGFGALLQRFLTVDGGTEVYGGLSVSKAVNTPIGLVGNLFYAYPSDYAGLRWLLRNHATDGWAVWLLVLLLANVVGAVVLAGLVWRRWGSLSRSQRLPLVAASFGLAFTLVGPIYWNPTYDKLWLQPIAAIVLLVGFALAALPPSRNRRAIMAGCMTMVFMEVLSNCLWVIPNFSQETPYLHEAQKVNEMLRPDDLLIDDWDRVSILYVTLYGFGRPQLCLPSAAYERGAAVIDDLREMIRRAETRGGRVYFLGVMDHTEASWQPFLGAHLHVPYHALDEFRDRCRPVATFQIKGTNVTLQLYR